MALDWKWWHAQANLGVRLVVHYLKKLWPWRERFGLERFQQNYVVEGLPPTTGEFRLLAHQPGRCTACGACDMVCPILLGTTAAHAELRPDFLGPMGFILAGTRGAPQLSDALHTLSVLNGPTCSSCRACDGACPERIPIEKLAAVFAQQQRTIAEAQTGKLPITDAKRALPAWVGRPGR
jgi:formate hydrogenlyase subunit 6/NADH:ubiquinone oxidoreductase subunit I